MNHEKATRQVAFSWSPFSPAFLTDYKPRSDFISPRNFNNGMSLRGAPQGDAAISLYENEIASPSARNDITAKGARDTYETASKV